MSIMVTHGLFTREDLDAMPDDGRRYELLDGAIVMSPSPGLSHQRIALRLAIMLDEVTRNTEFEAVIAPWDVEFGLSVLEPDVVVARRDAMHEKGVDGVPLLVVEVASPSTRRLDTTAKISVYEQSGVQQYWLVDPAKPSARVLELRGEVYSEVAHVAGDSMVEDLRAVARELLAPQ
jgi:Uma2 family endonuclease